MQLPKIFRRLTANIDLALRRKVVKNLVFKGGGIRGVAYMGALEALDELGIVDHIERAAGTSAGAIAATVFSFRLSIADTQALFNTLDITKVPQVSHREPLVGDRPRDRIMRIIQTPDLDCYNRFFTNYGWYSSRYFYEWLQAIIAKQCEGNGLATFADFEGRGFRELYIVAANISRQRPEIFSAKHTPDVAVADAVRMSMSIPMFFEALQFDGKEFGQGDYYVDGGLYDNFPMDIFDGPEFSKSSLLYRDGINWETLGLFLYPAEIQQEMNPKMPKNVWEFSSLMLRSLYNAHQVSNYHTNPVDKQRTIEISDCGIPPTEFSITQGSEKYNQLYESGHQAVKDFFTAIE